MISEQQPSAVLRSMLLSMESLGYDAKGALTRLHRSPRAKTAWDELLTTLESFFATEGVAQTQRLMQHWACHSATVLAATELLCEPRETYGVLLEVAARQSLMVVAHRLAPSGGLHLTLTLNKGSRPSMVFFQSCVWFLAAVPRARGLGDARVVPERLTELELSALVLPPSDGRHLTLTYAEPQMHSIARDLFSVRQPMGQSARALPTAQTLQTRFGLTRAEARVVRRLAEGLDIKSIALELKVSPETARTHAKRAMQKTDTHRQAELVSLVLQGQR